MLTSASRAELDTQVQEYIKDWGLPVNTAVVIGSA